MIDLSLAILIFGATYPVSPALSQGSGSTAVNAANWNTFVDNINAIGADLVTARGDGQAFPGTDHSASQSTDIDDSLQAIRHMLADISGESNWYDDAAGSLKVHTHVTGQGGAVPWSSIATGTRGVELHPEYPGAVRTTSLRGASPSGSNTVTEATGQDVVSYIARNYYENESSETSLQDNYVALRWTLPEDFTSWASSNAIQIEFRTESGTSINSHVDVYIYESGNATLAASDENNAGTTWSTITIDDSALDSAHTWTAGDILELYIKLETRNSYYARVGKIRFNYES